MHKAFWGTIVLLVVIACAIGAYHQLKHKKYRFAVYWILLLGLALRIIASTDPYLHAWDERYHALVAKNLIEHPLKPTLHEHPVLEFDNANWVGSNIWVGKPPFPLWLMSGSIAVFGSNLFAVRLPSVLLSLLAIWLTFLIGKKWGSSEMGAWAAFLFAINGLLIELAGGRVSSDHVELCFVVMVEWAFYLMLCAVQTHKFKYMGWAGIVAGLAFLSKWYPVLIVFPVGAVLLVTNTKWSWKNRIRALVWLSGGILLIVLPWLMYAFQTFPVEIKAILTGALVAYSETVEMHTAPVYYYWHKLLVIYGELVYLILGYAAYLIYRKEDRAKNYVLLVWALLPVIVFSFADTKRFTYLLISAPAFFMLAAQWIVALRTRVQAAPQKGWLIALLLITLVLPLRYTVERTKLFTPVTEVPAFYNLPDDQVAQWDEQTIVFGTDDYVEIMFHTPVYAAYREIPAAHKIDELKAEGYTVVVLMP